MKIIDLTEGAGLKSVESDALYRLTLPTEGQLIAPKEEGNGDVLFSCIAVDKNKVPNRRGFVFDWDAPEDIDLKHFLTNPVMPWQHEREYLPMGRWEQVEITPRAVKLSGRIPGGPDYEDIKGLRVRVRDGYLRAVSIGFYIRRVEEVLDKSGKFDYYKVKSFELVECSVCLIGAHPTSIIGQDGASASLKSFSSPAGARWDRSALAEGVLLTLSLESPAIVPATGNPEGAAHVDPGSPPPTQEARLAAMEKAVAGVLQAVERGMASLAETHTKQIQALEQRMTALAADSTRQHDSPPTDTGATPTPVARDDASVELLTSESTFKEAFRPVAQAIVKEALGRSDVQRLHSALAADALEGIAARNRARRKAYFHG